MAGLSLSLLGPFRADLHGERATGFKSDKVRALLSYLAAEADRPHSRASLAALLWPEWPDQAAATHLRDALSNLRRTIGDTDAAIPLVLVARDTIQLNPAGDSWVDAGEFVRRITNGLSPACRSLPESAAVDLQSAVDLYRGPFLEGFSVKDSAAFEEWALLKREQLAGQLLAALRRLSVYYEQRGENETAQAYTRRELQLEPWDERAHRRLMRLLALAGQRGAALQQYVTCRRVLAEELGTEPAPETTALCEAIRHGQLGQAGVPDRRTEVTLAAPRPTSWADPPPSASRPPVFVAREQELAQLERHLALVLDGRGRVVFVTGEAGSGKTALMREFVGRALASHPDLVAAFGSCNIATGMGDPYLPFREILQMLACDIEGVRSSGPISPEHARRLWSLLPAAAQALVERGPALVDVFVRGADLLLRADSVLLGRNDATWQAQLAALVQRRAESVFDKGRLQQTNVCEQVSRVLQEIGRRGPLLLVLDDLQWIDVASVSLLFHLGRHLAGSAILVLAAYRTPDVELGRDGARHPLAVVINELQQQFGENEIDLTHAAGREFLEALLDSEPNELGLLFRDALYQRTGGQALFTVELLRGLQERGDLLRNRYDRWVEGPQLNWEQLPARVEAAIAERIMRLPPELQQLLAAASAEGEEFTAEAVARAQGVPESRVIRSLSGSLSHEHRLVVARGVRRAGGQRLSTYRFRHSLFQQYLYGRLDPIERSGLHEALGLALEALHGAAAGQLALELARHFDLAGQSEKAVSYSLQAGKRAMEMSAHQEAVRRFRRGLDLLAGLPDSRERDRQELDLQLALGSALLTTAGMGSQEQIVAFTRAYELSQRLGEHAQLWPALHSLASSSTARGEYQKALELGEQLLGLAERSADPAILALAHFTLGATLFSSGISLVRSREHFEQAISWYERVCENETRRVLTSLNVFDVGVNARGWLATVLWILGYPDQALQRSQEALARAQQAGHFLSEVLARYAAGHAHQYRGENQALCEDVVALEHLVSGKHLLVGEVWAEMFRGWLLVCEGKAEDGLTRMRGGAAAWQRTGAVFGTTAQLLLLAEGCLRGGQIKEGLESIATALALVDRTGARPNEAELYRLRGELLLALGEETHVAEADGCFRRALALARGGEQRAWELRAATSLARLQQKMESPKRDEAAALLAGVYGRFSEGFGIPDLRDAAAVLAQISGHVMRDG